jgi:hypothetical protein
LGRSFSSLLQASHSPERARAAVIGGEHGRQAG